MGSKVGVAMITTGTGGSDITSSQVRANLEIDFRGGGGNLYRKLVVFL